MKVVILAGGFGTRLMEETVKIPKPMVEIGGKPILWHIMKIYSYYGLNDFIICTGYKSEVIKQYFLNYHLLNSDFKINLETNEIEILNQTNTPFKVTLIDTGLNTNTAGRIKKIKNYVKNDKSFCLTYGDGVSDIDINSLIDYHNKHNKLATLTAVKNTGRYGTMTTNINGQIIDFNEKVIEADDYINGGFFVLENKIFKYLEGNMDDIQWEKGPLKQIARDGQLMSFKHNGYWKAMDALRDKLELEDKWNSNKAPWKIWD